MQVRFFVSEWLNYIGVNKFFLYFSVLVFELEEKGWSKFQFILLMKLIYNLFSNC